jgi:hypothetical protein
VVIARHVKSNRSGRATSPMKMCCAVWILGLSGALKDIDMKSVPACYVAGTCPNGPAALQAVAGKRDLPVRRAGAGHEMLERLARQVAVLPEILARLEVGADGRMGERSATHQQT